MTTTPEQGEFVRILRERLPAEGNVLWVEDNKLGIFDAELARRVHAHNFAGRPFGDRLADILRRRDSPAVTWDQVRSAWLGQLRTLSGTATTARLAARMRDVIDARLDQDLDLVWFAHEVITRTLIPTIIEDLPARANTAVHADVIWKISHLMASANPGRRARPLWWLHGALVQQVQAGLAVRGEIRGRVHGSRPPRADLTEPIVRALLPDLGMDRAVEAVTAMLTAIAGPPGAAAACLLYELHRQPHWTAILRTEHAGLTDERFHAAPVPAAPVTHRFVKEVLRMWSPPLMLARVVQRHTELPGHTLRPGQQYLLSPYLIHHDPARWPDPDTFDPDRWLPGAPGDPDVRRPYVPFGWAPTSCIGAGLGLTQMMVLCRLLTTRYTLTPAAASEPVMMLAAVPIPRHFTGQVTRTRSVLA